MSSPISFLSSFSETGHQEVGRPPTDDQMDIIFKAVIEAGLTMRDSNLNLKDLFVQIVDREEEAPLSELYLVSDLSESQRLVIFKKLYQEGVLKKGSPFVLKYI